MTCRDVRCANREFTGDGVKEIHLDQILLNGNNVAMVCVGVCMQSGALQRWCLLSYRCALFWSCSLIVVLSYRLARFSGCARVLSRLRLCAVAVLCVVVLGAVSGSGCVLMYSHETRCARTQLVPGGRKTDDGDEEEGEKK